jgi:hypothetical protein
MSSNDERVASLLEELVAWTKFATRPAILTAWETILGDDRHLLAYELSDGSRTQLQVAEAAKLSQPTVSGLWARWRRLGIARAQGKTVVHLARPSDLGMERAIRLAASTSRGSGVVPQGGSSLPSSEQELTGG